MSFDTKSPGAVLPSERELCDEFNVSRGTARQALAELEKAGIVYRKQGRGTFVSTLDHQHATMPLDDNALVRDMARQGILASVTLLASGKAAPPETRSVPAFTWVAPP